MPANDAIIALITNTEIQTPVDRTSVKSAARPFAPTAKMERAEDSFRNKTVRTITTKIQKATIGGKGIGPVFESSETNLVSHSGAAPVGFPPVHTRSAP